MCIVFVGTEKALQFANLNLTDIVTPVNWKVLEELLHQSNYCGQKTLKLVTGFREGFDLCYEGPQIRCSKSGNLPFSISNKVILWNKLMKEVSLGRVAGPFKVIPFEHYIQSPIGLVPKDKGSQTRLIFHLSYDFPDGKSVNYHTPKEKCSVKYNDLDEAVKCCLYQLRQSLANTPKFTKGIVVWEIRCPKCF